MDEEKKIKLHTVKKLRKTKVITQIDEEMDKKISGMVDACLEAISKNLDGSNFLISNMLVVLVSRFCIQEIETEEKAYKALKLMYEYIQLNIEDNKEYFKGVKS